MDLLASFLIFCIATSSLGTGDSQSIFNVAFTKAWITFCGTAGTPTLVIPPGKTFLLQPVTFRGPCKSSSVHLQVSGNVVAPNSTQLKFPDGKTDSRWLTLYDVQGILIDGSGTIDGRGSVWWSQVDASKRPTHNCNNLQANGITLVNSPRNHISINSCNGVSVANIHIDSTQDSPNTDGIVISASTHVNIHDCFIKSGGDCIALHGGCSFINITGVACGPGHGITVGSLGRGGSDDKVEEVHVRNCSFTGTQNGARIKTIPGSSGYARKISFEQITIIASRNPIIIDQHYCNGYEFGCQRTSSVNVSEVTYSGFLGTSADEQAVTLDCSDSGCFNIRMDQVNIISSMPRKATTAFCKNAHGPSSTTAPRVLCLSG